MSTSTTTSTTIKLVFKDEIRRVSISNHSFSQLSQLVSELFGSQLPTRFVLQYTDPDGDLITVNSQQDLNEAIRVAQQQLGVTLKLQVGEKIDVEFVPVNNNDNKDTKDNNVTNTSAVAAQTSTESTILQPFEMEQFSTASTNNFTSTSSSSTTTTTSTQPSTLPETDELLRSFLELLSPETINALGLSQNQSLLNSVNTNNDDNTSNVGSSNNNNGNNSNNSKNNSTTTTTSDDDDIELPNTTENKAFFGVLSPTDLVDVVDNGDHFEIEARHLPQSPSQPLPYVMSIDETKQPLQYSFATRNESSSYVHSANDSVDAALKRQQGSLELPYVSGVTAANDGYTTNVVSPNTYISSTMDTKQPHHVVAAVGTTTAADTHSSIAKPPYCFAY
jgi:hypothetical protein